MVIANKERAIIRDSVTIFIETLLSDTDTNTLDIEQNLEQLKETSVELRKSDVEIKKLVQEEQLETGLQKANEYREKISS